MTGSLLAWMDARRAAAALPAPRRTRWTVAYDVGGVEWCTDGAALWRTGAPAADRLAWTGLRAIQGAEDVEAMIAGVAGSARYPARVEGGRVVCARGSAEVDGAYLPLLSGELELEYAAAPINGTPAAWTAAERVRAATGQIEPPAWPEIALCVRSRIGEEVVAVVCCVWSDPAETATAAPAASVADIPDPDGGGSRDWAQPPDLVLGGRMGVPCLTRTSKWLAVSVLPADIVISEHVIVFALPTWRAYALLQSIVHVAWARFAGLASTMQSTARYTPSTIFSTLPFPRPDPAMLDMLGTIGRDHYEARVFAQRRLGIGATKLFNRIHDPAERCPWVLDVRDLQMEMDEMICDAYGWQDINPPGPCEMPPNPEGATLPTPPAIGEIVTRLRRLNRKRAAEQAAPTRPHLGSAP